MDCGTRLDGGAGIEMSLRVGLYLCIMGMDGLLGSWCLGFGAGLHDTQVVYRRGGIHHTIVLRYSGLVVTHFVL